MNILTEQPELIFPSKKQWGTKRPTAIDLFAGCGGFSLGLLNAGFHVRVAVEIDKWAASTYRWNHKHTVLMERDIRSLTGKKVLAAGNLKKGELDLLVGGPPCQGFTTIAKNRSIDDPRSRLMWEFIRMVGEMKPRIFEIENVPGLLYFKDFFILLMETLEKKGYIVRCLMMNACDYGVPQHRKRIFIQGVRKDLNKIPIFPTPTTPRDPEVDKKAKKNKAIFPPSLVKMYCFAPNGFPKGEVKDLYWNSTLNIQMNKKTASHVLDVAIGRLIAEGIKETYEKQMD